MHSVCPHMAPRTESFFPVTRSDVVVVWIVRVVILLWNNISNLRSTISLEEYSNITTTNTGTCENIFKSKTPIRGSSAGGLTRLSDRDACSSCDTHCSSTMTATCEAALLQSGDFSVRNVGREFQINSLDNSNTKQVPCDFTQCDAKGATTVSYTHLTLPTTPYV